MENVCIVIWQSLFGLQISHWLPSPALYGLFCGWIFLTTEEENKLSQIPNDICTTTFFTTETINMCCQQDQERYQARQNLELYMVMFSMWISYYLHCFLFFAIETPLCIMVWFLLWSPDYRNSQPHQFKLDKVTTHFAPDWADLHTFPYHWHVQNESQKLTFPVVKRTFLKFLLHATVVISQSGTSLWHHDTLNRASITHRFIVLVVKNYRWRKNSSGHDVRDNRCRDVAVLMGE